LTDNLAIPPHRRFVSTALAAAAALLLLLVPPARAGMSPIVWQSPTRANMTKVSIGTGDSVSFTLRASTPIPNGTVQILPTRALPVGSRLSSIAGSVATATFRWTPSYGGDFTIGFAASIHGHKAVGTRTYTIHVTPHVVSLTNAKVAHWAAVLQPTVARSAPRDVAHAVTTLDTVTTDNTQNDVLVLGSISFGPTETWYHVRLPILPNNSTGWVPSTGLSALYAVYTHLYVDRAHLRATLKRDGRTIFTTIVGVGRSYWPTPAGQFYVRDKLTGFGDPVYGPVMFGTSARSAVLTDWPGGGYVGIHGTDEPQILPGYVSHGCIRMPNSSIVRLAKLMTVGTPITIT
jgi:lipoprotein-anchoring transpeptidase ErfK/SrfK